MSNIITGTPSHVTTPLTATVAALSSGAGGVWRVQTSAPHLFGDGDYVQVAVAGPVTVYGFIVVVDATHFDVLDTTYTATAAGIATDLSLTPQFLVPTDGDSFSLQLSGMLSALQCLADRTQALRYLQVARAMLDVTVVASGNILIPPWATFMLVVGCGGGAGAGGGPGGFNGVPDQQCAAGGGGAGARRILQILQIIGAPTSVDVVIGPGGTGGAAGGGGPPTNASNGTDGSATTVTWHNGAFAGTTFVTLPGGARAAGGSGSSVVSSSSTGPIFTPGGRGQAGKFRGGPAVTQLSPGFRQLQGILTTLGVLNVQAGAWSATILSDPVGQMDPQEGGASVANGDNSNYPNALPYAGADSLEGTFGGAAGANGTASSTYPGGAGGGGGGAGGGGPGGAGGHGGNGNSSGAATDGTAGASAGANTGGGGGGGGGGGNGSSAAGAGKAGGAGGSGFLGITWLGIQQTP